MSYAASPLIESLPLAAPAFFDWLVVASSCCVLLLSPVSSSCHVLSRRHVSSLCHVLLLHRIASRILLRPLCLVCCHVITLHLVVVSLMHLILVSCRVMSHSFVVFVLLSRPVVFHSRIVSVSLSRPVVLCFFTTSHLVGCRVACPQLTLMTLTMTPTRLLHVLLLMVVP